MDEDYLNLEDYGEKAVRMLEGDYEGSELREDSKGPTKLLSDEELDPKQLLTYGTGFLLLAAGSGWQAIEQGEPTYGVTAVGTGMAGSAQIGAAVYAYQNRD